MSEPVHISDVLSRLLKRKPFSKRIEEQKALFCWDRAVGMEISKHTKPIYVRDGRLVVVTDDSVWMNELSLLKERIIEKLNSIIGENIIKDILFRMG